MSGAFRSSQGGLTLIEVLVSLLVSVVGLLGVAAMQLRSQAATAETMQRAHAALLLQDMVTRIQSNYLNANSYVANDVGTGDVQACGDIADRAGRDVCEWGNLIRGVSEIASDESRVGAVTAGIGCVTSPAANVYIVAVVWQGVAPSGAPGSACGANAYGAANENLRRAVTAVIRIPDLGA